MQTTGLKRNTVDKFYTKPNVSLHCCQLLQQYIHINPLVDIIVEPSAGNGSFIGPLTNICDNCVFYDIEPENDLIMKQDYLELKSIVPNLHTNIHVVGNPPFGRQSTLAIKFIKKSAEFCNSISFILPKSFKKDSMQKHFPKNFHLLYQEDLEEKSFIINETVEKDVPCVFQIWQKKDYNRPDIEKMVASHYTFIKQEDKPDISFRRVGVNAGVIDTENLNDKSIQSHYFIKFDDSVNKKDVITKIKQIKYTNNNTVGPKSICKPEIICEFNKLFLFFL
jgi:hypothetical protein